MSNVEFDNLPNDDAAIINSQERAEFQSSPFFYRIRHRYKKLLLDRTFFAGLLSYFNETFCIHDIKRTERIWHYILKSQGIFWRRRDDLTVGKFKQIYAAFEEALVLSGPGVNVSLVGEGYIHGLTQFLLAQNESLPSLGWEILKSIFVFKNAVFLTAFRWELSKALQAGLNRYHSGLVSEEVFRGFVFNILAFLPYTYPEEGTRIHIPVENDGEWQMSEYKVDKKFEMTPSWFSSPFPIYGLISPDAPPILVSLGTTYPAGEGFVASFLVNYIPGCSVGLVAYLYGRAAIEKWLEDKNGVRLIGISLGGILSLFLANHHSSAISEVYAFNPPGPYPWNRIHGGDGHIKYHIYFNENDIISSVGVFPTGDNVVVYHVIPKKGENFLVSHMRVYLAAESVSIVRTSAAYENKRIARVVSTVLHITLNPLLFFIILPIQLIYRIFECLYRISVGLCGKSRPKAQKKSLLIKSSVL